VLAASGVPWGNQDGCASLGCKPDDCVSGANGQGRVCFIAAALPGAWHGDTCAGTHLRSRDVACTVRLARPWSVQLRLMERALWAL
jgi:hypothetical protein